VQAERVIQVSLQPPLQQLVDVQHHLSDDITDVMETKLRTVVNLALGRETNWPAGGLIFSSCWQLKKFQSNISSGFLEQTKIPGRFQSLSISLSLFILLQ